MVSAKLCSQPAVDAAVDDTDAARAITQADIRL